VQQKNFCCKKSATKNFCWKKVLQEKRSKKKTTKTRLCVALPEMHSKRQPTFVSMRWRWVEDACTTGIRFVWSTWRANCQFLWTLWHYMRKATWDVVPTCQCCKYIGTHLSQIHTWQQEFAFLYICFLFVLRWSALFAATRIRAGLWTAVINFLRSILQKRYPFTSSDLFHVNTQSCEVIFEWK